MIPMRLFVEPDHIVDHVDRGVVQGVADRVGPDSQPAESLAHVAACLGADHPGRLVYFGGEVFVRSAGAGQSAAPYSVAGDLHITQSWKRHRAHHIADGQEDR
jgi:hypothetical protein